MFFQVIDSVFSINDTGDSTNSFFDSMLQLGSVNFQQDNSSNSVKWTGDGVELVTHLERILAVPVLVFNYNFLMGADGGRQPTQNAKNPKINGALASPSYRVIPTPSPGTPLANPQLVINSISFWVFIAGVSLSWFWSFLLLGG